MAKYRTIIYFTATLLYAGSVFFANYYLSQKLNYDDYGLFSLFFGTLSLLIPLIMIGQATAITSVFFSDHKKDNRSIYKELNHSNLIMVSAAGIFITIIVILWLLGYLNKFNSVLIGLFVLTVVIAAFREFFLSLMVCEDNYRLYIYFIGIFSIALTASILIKPDINGFFIGMLIGSLIVAIWGYIYSHQKYSKNEPSGYQYPMKTLVIMGLPAIVGSMISSANAYADRYIIGFMMSLKDVALYSLAATVSIGVGAVAISALIKPYINPLLSSLQEDNKEIYLNTVKRSLMILSLLSVVAVIIYFLCGHFLVKLVFGEKYLPSLPFFLPLFLTTILSGANQIFGFPLIQKNKLYLLVITGGISMLINIILSIVFIKIFGIIGAIFAIYLSFIALLILSVYFSTRYFSYIKFPLLFVVLQSLLIIISIFLQPLF